jgi:hypothetical protein
MLELGQVELQPDGEHQEHHPELGQVGHGAGVLGHGQGIGADQHAHGQIAQHRRQLEQAAAHHPSTAAIRYSRTTSSVVAIGGRVRGPAKRRPDGAPKMRCPILNQTCPLNARSSFEPERALQLARDAVTVEAQALLALRDRLGEALCRRCRPCWTAATGWW